MEKNKALVLLDNGHGADTPGKQSPDGSLKEYMWCRDEVKMIADKLNAEGIQSVILVPEIKDIPLSKRVERANKIYIDNGKNKKGKFVFLISVHVNAAGMGGWTNASGYSVYVSGNASENSKRLAVSLYGEAKKAHLEGNRSVPKEEYWTAGFYIIKNTKCPAVLSENLFMDNRDDCAYLLSDKGKETIANMYVEAIKKFIQETPWIYQE